MAGIPTHELGPHSMFVDARAPGMADRFLFVSEMKGWLHVWPVARGVLSTGIWRFGGLDSDAMRVDPSLPCATMEHRSTGHMQLGRVSMYTVYSAWRVVKMLMTDRAQTNCRYYRHEPALYRHGARLESRGAHPGKAFPSSKAKDREARRSPIKINESSMLLGVRGPAPPVKRGLTSLTGITNVATTFSLIPVPRYKLRPRSCRS